MAILDEHCKGDTRGEVARRFRGYLAQDMQYSQHGKNRDSFARDVVKLARELVS